MYHYMIMPKASKSTESLPEEVLDALQQLGANLRIARERRGESLRARAARMSVSVATLRRLEQGDPSVGLGICATAIWLSGQLASLSTVAAPETDAVALEREILRARRRRS
jgi:hypothetical protein